MGEACWGNSIGFAFFRFLLTCQFLGWPQAHTHTHMKERDDRGRFLPGRKGSAAKTKEAAERERKHQFGQPEGNPQCPKSTAVAQREFYRWVECYATEDELNAYVLDETKPAIRRNFIATLMGAKDVEDFFALTNQVHGAPKQTLELKDMPVIECKCFGE